MKPRLIVVISLVILMSHPLIAQNVPFQKGVNLTEWFQASSPQAVHLYKYRLKDFKQIKSLGCDVVRLPINLHAMTDGAPNYTVDPLLFRLLDSVVYWAEQTEMHLILDNHTFDPAVNTDVRVGEILERVWPQLASYYSDKYDRLYYEILNEPHGIDNSFWNSIQWGVIKSIRAVDTTHMIIVGGAEWNSYNTLDELPYYDDDKLIYTFHFYDPFIFTHQGATWTGPSLGNLRNIPFPYQENRMPVLPTNYRGTWIEWLYNNYNEDGTATEVQELLEIAVDFKNERKVPVFCGEFGVFIPYANNEDRVAWYQQVRTYLEANDIAWTSWDYHSGFGLFEANGSDLFEHSLNIPLVRALGFNEPEQTPLVITPEQTGFQIYDDFIGENIISASYSKGSLDYYQEEEIYEGQNAIYWEGAGQYDVIGFDFRPDKDFTTLVAEDYVLDFWIRGEAANTRFDIRFIDTKEEGLDLPWRSRVTIDQNEVSWDGQWHRLSIPLSSFREHGSWYDGQWFTPKGQFDWSSIDQLDFVAEHGHLRDQPIWIDDISIRPKNAVTNINSIEAEIQLEVYPNPTAQFLQIQSQSTEHLKLDLFDSGGRKLETHFFQGQLQLDISNYPAGLYMLSISGSSFNLKKKIILSNGY